MVLVCEQSDSRAQSAWRQADGPISCMFPGNPSVIHSSWRSEPMVWGAHSCSLYSTFSWLEVKGSPQTHRQIISQRPCLLCAVARESSGAFCCANWAPLHFLPSTCNGFYTWEVIFGGTIPICPKWDILPLVTIHRDRRGCWFHAVQHRHIMPL